MLKLLKLEIRKMLTKKDIMLIFGVLVLTPFFFSFCLIKNVAGINFNGQISVESYGIMIWSFLKYLFVLYLVPIYIACSFIGREIENRSINIMLSNAKRMKVLAAKIITYLFFMTGFFILFQMAGIISYFVFVQGTDFAAVMEASIMETIFLYLFQWLEMIFVLFVSIALCCIIKGNIVLLLGIGAVILQKLLVNIEIVKRVLPYCISDYNYYSMIPKENLFTTNMVSMSIYMGILLVLLLIAIYTWEKRDF